MTAKRKRSMAAGTEWVGGIIAMPAYVTGEGEPYRPEALLWMIPDGPVLGVAVEKTAGTLFEMAAEHLRSTIDNPKVAGARPPTRVRVASAELTAALREAHSPALEVVCAPTPELDDVIASMREHLDRESETEQSYLAPDIGPDAVASFFRATAALYCAKPWSVVPNDTSVLSLSIEKLGVRDMVVSVIGQMGESHGVILFKSLDDFDAFIDAADAIEHGAMPAMPPHFALNFERGAELSPALRKEIAVHRWEIAGANAYPWLVAVDEDLVARPPTAKEMTLVEALSLALADIMADKRVLAAAWDGGEPVTRTLSVKTHAGELEVTLRAPYDLQTRAGEPIPDDIIGALSELAERGERDEERRMELEDELVRRFESSPEAKSLGEVHWAHAVLELAADYLGMSISAVDAPALREVLFELFPRKVSVDPSEAGDIVAECRALFAFLKREFRVRHADACMGVLGDGAVKKKLEAALSDPRKFGMAKSIMMAGAQAGFDMSTKEGLEGWMHEVQGKPLPASMNFPSLMAGAEAGFEISKPEGVEACSLGAPRRADPKSARLKKEQRKAARKARKKNR
jgi:hypothetical protein